MGNLGVTFKRFFGNKNTVTIIGVFAAIAVLYFGYQWRVQQEVELIPIPFATRTISGNTQITAEMVSTVRVNRAFLNNAHDVVQASNQVIGMFVRYDTTVVEGSPFFRSQIMPVEQLPNFMIRDIPDGFTLYSLPVTLHMTYGNSIMPGDYIDLFFSAVDDNRRVIFGRFIESIRVLSVKDSRGQHVFTSASNADPAFINFAVPDNFFILLRMTDLITTNNIQITPVPRNLNFSENPSATTITSIEIEHFIRARAMEATQNTGNDGFDTRPPAGNDNNFGDTPPAGNEEEEHY